MDGSINTTKKRMTLGAIVAILAMVGGGSLDAQNALSISAAPTTVSIPWAFDTGISQPLDITVTHSGAAVDYFLTVSAGDNGQFEPRLMDNGRGGGPMRAELPYLIETPTDGVAKDLSVPLNATNVISGGFTTSGTEQSVSHRFDVSLTGDTFQRDDTYSDSVVVRLYEGVYTDSQGAVERDTATMAINTTIPQLYEIRLVPVGASEGSYDGGYDMFLGDLTNGASEQVDLLYRTNMSYKLEASSANAGDLVSDAGDRIPYAMIVAGRSYRLNNTARLINSRDPTGADFVRETVTVTVDAGDVTGSPPGYYTDVVTFEVIAR